MKHSGLLWEQVSTAVAVASGLDLAQAMPRPVTGGDINRAYELAGPTDRCFVKLNRASRLPMFEAEAAGLEALATAAAVRVPAPLAWGTAGDDSWLALEWLEFGPADTASQAALGTQLAALHRCTAKRFGWQRDNTIGTTPQPNGWRDDWIDFLREQRLGFQLGLAANMGAGRRLIERGEALLATLPRFFWGYSPQPSLLHGDLWGGNWGADADGQALIFDPAVYYGDRETDLAMTELFGGFGDRFYSAYEAAWPLDPGYPLRRPLYQLYHVLNHFNLFGGSYEQQALRMTEALLAELG